LIINQFKIDEQDEKFYDGINDIEKQKEIERALEKFCQLLKEEEDRKTHFL